jgi:Fe-S cluster assembly iron-binding protein IscA
MVDISPAAAAEIERISSNRQNSSLRLIVRTGGCSGLYYDLKFDEVATKPEVTLEANATKTSMEKSSLKSSQQSSSMLSVEDECDRTSDRQSSISSHSATKSNKTHDNSQFAERLIQINGIELKVDSQSWKYVEHLKLDYSQDLMGGGFRFHNPQIKNICGCGISFAKAK